MHIMPRRFKVELPPLKLSEEPIGNRISRLRKILGLSQADLAGKIGIRRDLVSEYERGRLNMRADMAARFAIALNVTTDNIIGLTTTQTDKENIPDLKVMRRLIKIEHLTPMKQKVLLRMIDGYLKENNL